MLLKWPELNALVLEKFPFLCIGLFTGKRRHLVVGTGIYLHLENFMQQWNFYYIQVTGYNMLKSFLNIAHRL